jgi:hypothetical protein
MFRDAHRSPLLRHASRSTEGTPRRTHQRRAPALRRAAEAGDRLAPGCRLLVEAGRGGGSVRPPGTPTPRGAFSATTLLGNALAGRSRVKPQQITSYL